MSNKLPGCHLSTRPLKFHLEQIATEAILFGTRQQIQNHSELSTFRIGDDDVKIGESIRILGV